MAGLKRFGFRARRGTPRLVTDGAALIMALQWCLKGVYGAEGTIGEKGVLPGDALGGGTGAEASEATAGAAGPDAGAGAAGESSRGSDSLPHPRRRPLRRVRHLRSDAAPDRRVDLAASKFGGAGAGAGAGAGVGGGVGGGGAGAGVLQYRRRLSDPEAYVDSDEDCALRMEHTVSECDFQNRQNLMWSYGEGDSDANCTTPLPETASIKCDHVAWKSGEGVAIEMLAIVGIAVSLFFWVALTRYRKSRTVRLGQPGLCKTFVVGIAVTCLSVLALLGESGDLTCALSLWGYSAGFDVAFGALALKLWSALSSAESSMKFTSASLSTHKVLAVVALVAAGDAAVLVWWTATFGDNCGAEYESKDGLAFVRRDSCISCHRALFWIWICLKAAMVSLSLYISFRARRVESWVHGNGGVGMTTYNLAVSGLLVAAVIWAEANAQVRTTTEAVAIVLAGVGALVSILGPKISQAKQELEGKAVVGPSAVVADAGGGGIDALLSGGGRGYHSNSERGEGDGGHTRPRTSTLSELTGGGAAGGIDHGQKGGGGGGGGGGTGRRRRPLARNTPGGGNGGGGIPLSAGLMGSNKSTHTISQDADYDDGSRPIPSPLPPKEAAAFASATTAAALLDQRSNGGSSSGGGGGKSKRRHLLDQPRPKAPPAASVVCTRPPAGGGGGGGSGSVSGSGSGSGGVGGGGSFGGVFATTGGSAGTRLIKPDPTGFWTPPRLTRRARSSLEISTRSADAMALAAAAAGAAERKVGGVGAAALAEADAGGDARVGAGEGARKTLKEGLMSFRKSGRISGSVGDPRAERISSSTSVSGLGVDERETRRGGGSGSTTASQGAGGGSGGGGGQGKVASGASESSRASRASSSRGRSGRSLSHSQPHSSSGNRPSSSRKSSKRHQAASTSGGSVGGDSNSARSSRDRDSWAFDPLIMAINGYGWGAGGLKQTYSAGTLGGSGQTQKRKSSGSTTGGGPRVSSGMWSSGPRRRRSGFSSRDRTFSVGSAGTAGGGGGGNRRTSAASSLVMFAEKGTRLYCPHCEEEVAGCGFKGCSGSLVRPPSFSDDEFGPELFVAPPQPPPTLPPLVPAVLGGYTSAAAAVEFGGGGGLGVPSWGGAGAAQSAPGGGAGFVMSPSTQNSNSMQDQQQARALSSSAAAAVVAPVATAAATARSQSGGGGGGGGGSGGAHKSLSVGATRRLRMSFRRGPSACDTFDSDSSDLGDDDDDDGDDDGEEESQRSALGIYSPTSSSAWA